MTPSCLLDGIFQEDSSIRKQKVELKRERRYRASFRMRRVDGGYDLPIGRLVYGYGNVSSLECVKCNRIIGEEGNHRGPLSSLWRERTAHKPSPKQSRLDWCSARRRKFRYNLDTILRPRGKASGFTSTADTGRRRPSTGRTRETRPALFEEGACRCDHPRRLQLG